METAYSKTGKQTDGTNTEPANSAISEVPAAKLQSEPRRETEETHSMLKTLPNLPHTEMVFPCTTFPCHENLPLHVSPVTDNSKRFRNNPLSSFNGNFMSKSNLGHAMKRAHPVDVYVKPEAKKRCLDSFFQGKEEISEADFQMALIKRSIERKKEWVYNQVLQNLELTTPSDTNRVNVISDSQQGGAKNYKQNKMNTPFVNSFPHRSSFGGLVRVKDSKKVIDEEGNCYIDTDDYMSFNHHKRPSSSQGFGYSTDNTFNGHTKQEREDFDSCGTSAIPKRGLFLNLRINGGVAIDHDSMPKIAAIYTHAIKGRREQYAAQLRRHVQAKINGSFYKPTQSAEPKIEEVKEDESNVKEEAKWWPPSPESMPNDVMSRDAGEGLLKVMTADDLKAYGIPKEGEMNEARAEEEDNDVVVTKIIMAPSNEHRNIDTRMKGMNQKIQDELPALQLDAHGKAANYKEILLHYISQKLKNDPKNTSLESISSVAQRPRRKMTMEEVCRKLKDTREKLEKEELTWRRKLLSSLEVVLIKKIRRLEKESGDVVPDGVILEGAVMEKSQEDTKSGEKLGEDVKGSNSDIVAMMEDLTSENTDVESTRCKNRTERNSRSVSNIRGYESS